MHVSVLLTTYNGADFLRQTLDSVLAQRFDDFEVVVVDDASTDATPDLLAACADPRLQRPAQPAQARRRRGPQLRFRGLPRRLHRRPGP